MGAIAYGMAAFQALKAAKIHPNRPTYSIPSEIAKNQAMYQSMANTSRLPGQSIAENNIGSNNASSINAAMQAGGNSGDILATLGNVNNNSNAQYNNLAMQGAQMQYSNKDKLAQANESMADYKNQAFDYNENQPYELAYKRKMALEGAAYANVDRGAQNDQQVGMGVMNMYGCFHPETPIQMLDGSEKAICDIETGDETLGGIVDGVHKFKVCRMLNYKGVLVTGSHAVYENNKWIRVGESEYTTSTDIMSPVYNLSTRDHKIFINDLMFSDQDEVGMEEQKVINNHCLSLLNK
jgi:hypothetical protein